MWQQLTPYGQYAPVPCLQHPASTSDTGAEATQMTQYVWLGEDRAQLGDITELANYTATADYAGWDAPAKVLAYDDGHTWWREVTIHVEHVVTDEQDWMYYRLICSWDDHTETAIYTIDGRA
jgi:hypothetical protein